MSPSILKHYSIDLEANEDDIVTKITAHEFKKEDSKSRKGVYFLRTSLKMEDEETVW